MGAEAGRLLRGIAHHPLRRHHLVPAHLRGRQVLHLSPCHRTAQPPLRGCVSHPDELSRTGELPFALHGRLAGRSNGTAAGTDCQRKDSALTHDFAAALLGDVGQRVHARHQQPQRAEDSLRGQQPRPPEHLRGGSRPLQFPHRETHQQEGDAEIVGHHRRAAHHLFQGTGQPHRHGTKQQGGGVSGFSGLLAAGARLWRQGGEGGDEHRRQHLLRAGGGRDRQDAFGAFRQGVAEAAVHLHQPSGRFHLHQHADGFTHPAQQDFRPHAGHVRGCCLRQLRRAHRAEDFPCGDCGGQCEGRRRDESLQAHSRHHGLHGRARQRLHEGEGAGKLQPHQGRGEADCQRRAGAHCQ